MRNDTQTIESDARENVTFVALDVHKDQHTVAMLLPGPAKPIIWNVPNKQRNIKQMVKRVLREAPGAVRFCYEAGVCGFALKRQIESYGEVTCSVIAPSLIPIKPGCHVKTDRRDAGGLAPLFRAGLLTEVQPPNEDEESLRDMCRCREMARIDLARARQRLLSFLLRHAHVYRDGDNWTQKHMKWLGSMRLTGLFQQEVFVEYLQTVADRTERLERMNARLCDIAQSEPYVDVVNRLRCFKGIDTMSAILLIGELYCISRFTHPRQLMSYLGMTPSENSSGEKRRTGSITKAGNKHVRRILTEAAWHQGRSYHTSKKLRDRRKGQPESVVEHAKNAERRLYRRYWHLVNFGKARAKANMAVARELAGFVWSVLYTACEEGVWQRSAAPPQRFEPAACACDGKSEPPRLQAGIESEKCEADV